MCLLCVDRCVVSCQSVCCCLKTCLLFAAGCYLRVACCVLLVVWCVLCVVGRCLRWSVCVACCMFLLVVCHCMLCVVCLLVFDVVHCVLCVVRCLVTVCCLLLVHDVRSL